MVYHFSEVSDECRISDQWWIHYTEIHNDGPQQFCQYTELTLQEKCFMKFCMEDCKSDIPPQLPVSLINLLTNRYNNRLLALLRQFFLIQNTFVRLMNQYFPSCLDQVCWNLIST